METQVLLNYKEFAFLLKTPKNNHSSAIGGNTPNLVLKRMQGHYVQILPLKKILEFQD